jgi:uncharacterized delta-60 repeat protein
LDGKIVVGGYTTLQDFSFDAVLLRYNQSGIIDSTFGTNGIVKFNNGVQDVAYDIEIQEDQKILIAGTSGGFFFDDRDFLLARFNADGTTDAGFGSNGFILTTIDTSFDEANAMTVQQDGKIILAGKGRTEIQNDIAVVRYTTQSTAGIVETTKQRSITVYPNPVSTKGRIELKFDSGFKGEILAELFTLEGRSISVFNLGIMEFTKNHTSIPLSGELLPGVYFLKLSSENQTPAIVRLVIARN